MQITKIEGQELREANPWISIWRSPRRTFRRIIEANPHYGVVYLGSLFAMQKIFFYANWWSLGMKTPIYAILVPTLLLSPLIGMASIYIAGWIFSITGKAFRGKAESPALRAVYAWSKTPLLLSGFIWCLMILFYPQTIFIQDGGGPSSLVVNGLSALAELGSFIFLIQGLREVQGFSPIRSLMNAITAWGASTTLILIFFCLFRFIYLASV